MCACCGVQVGSVRVRVCAELIVACAAVAIATSRQLHLVLFSVTLSAIPLLCRALTRRVCMGSVSRTAGYKSLPADTKRMLAEFAQARGYGLLGLQEAR